MGDKKTVALVAVIAFCILCIILVTHFLAQRPVSVRGAVVATDPDPAKELPLGNVEVTVEGEPSIGGVRSNASGYFQLALPWRMRRNPGVTLQFRHTGYQELDVHDVAGVRLYIAHLTPLAPPNSNLSTNPEVKIGNIVAKYSINTAIKVNVGSAVKTFQVVNTGNVPCKGYTPCSPDGRWRAALGSAVIDAGAGNDFHNARASCIAGPCPFTRIEDNLSSNSQVFRVSAQDWSDTTTFELEAEVFKSVSSDVLRESYPVIFDRALTFTLPAAAQGVSIEAELNGAMIVFPLGPALFLSWASCEFQVNKDQTRVYRCELKPGFRFA